MSLSAFLSSPVLGVTKPLGQKGPSSVVVQSMDLKSDGLGLNSSSIIHLISL